MPAPVPGTKTGQVVFVNVGVTATPLLSPSQQRTGITFLGSNMSRVTFSNNIGVTLDNGPTLVQTSGPLELLYERHGEVVRHGWWGIAALANSPVGIIETLEG